MTKPLYKLEKLERPWKRPWEAKPARWHLRVTKAIGAGFIREEHSYWPTKKAALAFLSNETTPKTN